MAQRRKGKKIPWVLIIIVLIILAVVYFKFMRKKADIGTSFETTELSITDLESIVSSTGTLVAVGTLEVGTQVSGRLDSVLVDFNDHVVKDQILAILDRTTLKSIFRDTQANLNRAKAQYDLMREKFVNDSTLYEKRLVSSYEYKSSRTDLINSETSVISAEIAMEKADQNLNDYAIIRSPINGMVISREIEEGQTVQASMSAPTLFILAEDLKNMEIEALVDESDIGLIAQGQQIRFSVEAYPDGEFSGAVKQVRLQPKVVSDVVHYTVICSADNKKGILLPGMTATIDFIISSREQVTVVPNSAFNVQMPDSIIEKARSEQSEKRSPQANGEEKSGSRNGGNRQIPENVGRIWYMDKKGTPGLAIVEKGLSDGINTEILNMRNLPENAKIITKVKTDESITTSNQGSRGGFQRGHGPGLF